MASYSFQPKHYLWLNQLATMNPHCCMISFDIILLGHCMLVVPTDFQNHLSHFDSEFT